MHVISRKTLREAEKKHGDLVVPLAVWFKVARGARWKHIEDVRKTYAAADPVGRYTVFNIKGNSYRLIVKMEYAKNRIYIKAVQTHAEYDKGAWNK
ncbi:MAG: type II toxin-antitoxin system HigB family toxin [Acidobacteriia bacterium]|jgi:mRNA interferase HigB|nr:type II toxin-antitoxin system HigB family toxin [Terriglobia bacterium]